MINIFSKQLLNLENENFSVNTLKRHTDQIKMEWTEKIISTDIDELLKYLLEKGSSTVPEIAEKLDVPEETVKIWVGALEDDKIVEKHYSAKRGTVIKPRPENMKKDQEKVRDKAKKEIKKVKEDMEDVEELEQVKEHLRKLENIFVHEQEALEDLRKVLNKIKEDEKKIEIELEETPGEKALGILETIDRDIGTEEKIVEEKKKFKERKNNIEQYIKTIDRIEALVAKEKEEDDNKDGKKGLKEKIKNLFNK